MHFFVDIVQFTAFCYTRLDFKLNSIWRIKKLKRFLFFALKTNQHWPERENICVSAGPSDQSVFVINYLAYFHKYACMSVCMYVDVSAS